MGSRIAQYESDIMQSATSNQEFGKSGILQIARLYPFYVCSFLQHRPSMRIQAL